MANNKPQGPASATFQMEPLYAAPPAAPAPAVPAEDFCYCNDACSLQMVSGGAAPEGLYSRVTLLIGGKYVDYVRAESAAPAVPAVCDGGTCGLGGYCANCPKQSAAPAVREPLTDEQVSNVMAALLIARRYVLTNPEQHASVAYAINIMSAHRGIGGSGK